MDKDDDSGATATAVFLRNDVLVVSHIGDSSLVPNFSLYVVPSSCCRVKHCETESEMCYLCESQP
jgi:hypothetical protein